MPTGPIKLEVSTWNQLPANCRRSSNGRFEAMVNGQWRLVEFIRQPLKKPAPASCLPIPPAK